MCTKIKNKGYKFELVKKTPRKLPLFDKINHHVLKYFY